MASTGCSPAAKLFSAQEIDPIYQDYERIYGTSGIGSGETLRVATDVATGAFHPKQFTNMDTPAL